MSIYKREKVCKIHKFFKIITIRAQFDRGVSKKGFSVWTRARQTVDNGKEI